MRIRQLDLTSFKAFSRFTVTLGSNAFLVGPNNAGKSTLVAAARATGWMLGQASRRRPTGYRPHGVKRTRSHMFRADQFGLVTENLRHQFREEESSIALSTDTDVSLTAVWPKDDREEDESEPFFYLEHKDGRSITEPSRVRALTGAIGVIPGLYPLNHTERVLADDYLEAQIEGRRSSQHTRNHLLALEQNGELDAIRSFALEWLPELDRLDVRTRRSKEKMSDVDIDVFIRETGDRTEKELFWAGDGMQVFVQLLQHLWRLRDADVVVLDEPDLYLHADLQRRLVRLLEATGSQTVTATHSSEMLAEAPSDSVVWVDKSRRRGVRRPQAATLEDLSTHIGTTFNLRLASALRARVVLFVEGADMGILRALAATAGASSLAREDRCAVVELNGYSKWGHLEPFSWLVREFLDDAVQTFVLLDRDYRPDEERQQVVDHLASCGIRPHVWMRKELESYLLHPAAIGRAAGVDPSMVETQLNDITASLTGSVVGQFAAGRQQFERSSTRDPASILNDAITQLAGHTSDPIWRLHRYPPKEILSLLNRQLQEQGKRPVSTRRLAHALLREEIPDEMCDWLLDVESAL